MTFKVQNSTEQHTILDYKYAQIKLMNMVIDDFSMCNTTEALDGTLDFILSQLNLTTYILGAYHDFKKELEEQAA